MIINYRIKRIAEITGEAETLVDTGTDHALLPVWCVLQGKVKTALAIDINKGPLEAAGRNIAKHGLSDRIKTIQTDGLEGIEISSDMVIVIAGMGADQISAILKNCVADLSTVKKLILQPASGYEKLKFFLYTEGYEISNENFFIYRTHSYPVITAVKTSKDTFIKNRFDATLYMPMRFEEIEKEALKKFMKGTIKKQTDVLTGYIATVDPAADRQKNLIWKLREFYESL